MKTEKKLKYISNQIKDLFEVYIYINIKEDYKKGKDVTNIFCEAIANESEDFIQGVMDRFSENL